MKSITGSLFLFLFFFSHQLMAQLPNGSPAPDFALEIMSKISPDAPPVDTLVLSEVTGMGKGVVLFFMTSWCGPCWTYKEDMVLDTINMLYGPGGTDETRCLMIEIDDRTNKACIFNDSLCSYGIPRGDWTEVNYDITNLDTLNGQHVDSMYGVEFLPTLLIVSPDMRVYEVTERTIEKLESWIAESFKLTVTGTTVNASCGNDGAVVLLINGGYGTLSYEWSNGATTKDLVAIGAGTYSVTVTDENGYDVQAGPFTVTGALDTLHIDTLLVRDLRCHGIPDGEINVLGTGGMSPYSYIWSNGDTTARITGLSAGNYMLTLTDANLCEASFSFDITEPDELVLNYISFPERCGLENGSIEAGGFGGVPPLTYSIGGPFTTQAVFRDLKAGVYTLTLRDSSACTESEQVLVDSIPPPVADGGSDQYLGCGVDSVFLDGTGSTTGPGIGYLWTTRDGNILNGETTLTPIVDAYGTYTLFVTDSTTACIAVDEVEVSQDTTVLADAGRDSSLTCLVTQLMLDGTGSSAGPNIQYQWSTQNGNIVSGAQTLTPLVNAAGTYMLVVTDVVKMCSDTASVMILSDTNPPVVLIENPDSITCLRAAVTLDANRSSKGPEFRYEWNTLDGNIVSGANTLSPTVDAAGTYRLTIINQRNGCISFMEVTVVEFINTPVADFSHSSNVLTVNFTDQSTGSPRSWLWDFGDGNMSAEQNPVHTYAQPASYQVCLLIINECGQDDICKTFTLGTGMMLRLQEFVVRDVVCPGGNDGAIEVTIEGGVPPYMYSWSNGEMVEDLTNLTAGTYTLTVTDAVNASISATFTVNQPPPLVISDLVITNETMAGMDGGVSFEVSGGTPPYRFLWSNGSTEQQLSGVSAGDYTCTITDSKNCLTVVGPYTVGTDTYVRELNTLTSLEVFPNPVADEVQVRITFLNASFRTVSLHGVLGNVVKQVNINADRWEQKWDLSSLPPGLYLLRIEEDGAVFTYKLMVE